MANPLTGNFEAVVQIAMRQINGLLATLHQFGGDDEEPLKLLHSTTLRIGDRRFPFPHGFLEWVTVQQSGSSRPIRDIGAHLTATLPPGVASTLAESIANLDQVLEIPPPPPVRGLIKMQIASATLSIPSGSTSEVVVHAHARAHYYPDAGTTVLPEPVHGEVQATFRIRRNFSGTRLVVEPSPQENAIRFIAAPGSGVSPVQESRISEQVRTVVRSGIELVPVDLPDGFPFTDFKGLSGGVLALPLQLSGAASPPNGIQSISQSFIGSSGFALAVSEEHVTSLIDVEAIRANVAAIRKRFLGANYKFRFSSGPTLTFKNGSIEISGRVEVETSAWWAPNGFVSFRQAIRLVLNTSSQSVSLAKIGEAEVNDSLFIPNSTSRDIVRTEMDKAIEANAPAVNTAFSDARRDFVGGLRTFDPSASVTFAAIQITEDGIIVRGEIGRSPQHRRAPVVDVAETHQGAAFTAFKSWIPAGRIHRFVWSWIEHEGPLVSPWAGTEKSFTDEHRFIFPKPPGITDVSRICLRIQGTQILPNGQEVSAAAGTFCGPSDTVLAIDAPSWFEPVTLPIWAPDVAADAFLRDAVSGHVSVQADRPSPDDVRRNALVYFAEWRAERPLDALMTALAQVRDRSALDVIVVLPASAFDARRREVEARLGLDAGRAAARVHLTEDDEGGWTRTFGVVKVPSAYLVNARREFVWKHEGEPPAEVLKAALEKHLVPVPPARLRPLRAAVSAGDRAPDVSFLSGDSGNALHRLRGRDVLLNFWQSWSAPSLNELRRLQGLHAAGKGSPVIVAFHGGKDESVLDEIRRRLGISYSLVHDLEHRVARTYGVRCWPTTIAVNRDGEVEHVQFGAAHEHGARYPNQARPEVGH